MDLTTLKPHDYKSLYGTIKQVIKEGNDNLMGSFLNAFMDTVDAQVYGVSALDLGFLVNKMVNKELIVLGSDGTMRVN